MTVVETRGQRTRHVLLRHYLKRKYYLPWPAMTRRGYGLEFSPTIIDGLVLWLDATEISNLADGAVVTTWNDRSGQGNNVTQGVAGNKPLYKLGILNGKPVVRFDGADDSLATAGAILDVGTGNATIFAVVQADDTAGLKDILGDLTNVPGFEGIVLKVIGDETLEVSWRGAGATVLTGAGGTAWMIVSTQRIGTDIYLFRNGAQVDSDTTGDNVSSAEPLQIGRERSAGTEWFDGDIAEIIIYTAGLSTAQRQQVERYLGSKWGIALS